MLEGLHRLIGNGYAFSISDRTRQNMEEIKRADNSSLDFYESTGYIRFEQKTHATAKQLYSAYFQWCQDNAEKPLVERTFLSSLKKDANRLGLRYDKKM